METGVSCDCLGINPRALEAGCLAVERRSHPWDLSPWVPLPAYSQMDSKRSNTGSNPKRVSSLQLGRITGQLEAVEQAVALKQTTNRVLQVCPVDWNWSQLSIPLVSVAGARSSSPVVLPGPHPPPFLFPKEGLAAGSQGAQRR